MAASSGPGDFLFALVVLLVVLMVVVVAADWVMRSGVLRSRREDPEEKKQPEEEQRYPVVEDPQGKTDSMRVQRDYFSFGGRRKPSEVEREFGELFAQVNDALNEDPSGEATRSLFKRLDELIIRLMSALFGSKDQAVSLHMEHNYLWLKYRQSSTTDPTEAFLLLIQSLGKLMERERVQAYEPGELEWIMERYDGSMSYLNEIRDINFNRVSVAFFSFSSRYNFMVRDQCDQHSQDAVGTVMARIIRLILERHFMPMVQGHYLAELRVEHIQSIADQVDGLRRTHEASGGADPRIETMCHYMACRIKMYQLRTMTTLNPSPGRCQEIHEAHMKRLANDSAEEAKSAVEFSAKMLDRKDAGTEDRSIAAQTDVVHALAVHFQATYGKRLVHESWATMESVKRLVVQKALVERVRLSEELLLACDEEWGVLNKSTQGWLGRQMRRMSQEKGDDLGPQAGDGSLKALRVLSFIQEDGVPPAVFDRVLTDLSRTKAARGTYPTELRTLVRSITTKREGAIDPLDLPENWIGFHLDKGSAILFRLGPLHRDVEEMGEAMNVCALKGTRSVMVCVNFMQDMGSAEFLRKYATAFEKKNPRMTMTFFDTKDLMTALVSCLRHNGADGEYELTAGLTL